MGAVRRAVSQAVIARRGVRPLLALIGLAVTAGCMYLAVRGVDIDDAADALRESDLIWLVPAIPVFAAGIVLRGVRWWALYDADQRPPLRAVMYALLVGYFFNNILPARAGEAARVIALHSRAQTPRAETIATVVVERVYDILALLLILLCTYPWLPEISWLRNAAILGGVVTVLLAVLIVLIVRYDARAVHWLLSPLRRIKRAGVAERVEVAAVNATRGLVALRDPRVAFRGLALTIASWVVLAISFWILMDAFHLDLPLAAAILVIVAINLSLVLPSSPAALGVFEAATIIALNAFDVPHADALSYALVLHLLNLVPFLLIGAVLLGPAALQRNR
jgi:glycosyltransferase 2 family protein